MKKRQINKAKRYSHGCRNHGSCDYCKSARTHSNRHRAPIVVDPEFRERQRHV